jgi:nucleoside-diphosphate-sugar epimerase
MEEICGKVGRAFEEAQVMSTKILVTGATGFIGSKLIRALLENREEEDLELNLLERYVTGRYGNLDRRVSTHFADLRDFSSLRNVIKAIQPDIVVHLAAISPVSYSYDHPNEVMETNFQGTINLAESCRKSCENLQAFITAGTTEEYGVTPDRPANEDSRCFPNSPYSISKHASTEYLLYLNKAFDFPSIISRATNTYGRTDDTHFFIERMLLQMLREPAGKVFVGEVNQIRDFMYVTDHVNAYLSLIEKRDRCLGRIFNFATQNPKHLTEVIQIASRLAEFKGKIIQGSIPKRPLDINDHTIDSSRARNELGWKSFLDLEEGLDLTIVELRNKILTRKALVVGNEI